MQKTKNLELPIYDNPELDVFDLEDWNLANQNIDIAYEEMANFKQDLAKVDANSEIIEARKGKETLGDKIDEIDSSMEQSKQELSARMDTFTTLEQGSTTGDAELIDGRVSFDGKSYPNIGGAIRGQIKDLAQDLFEVKENPNIFDFSQPFTDGKCISNWSVGSTTYNELYDSADRTTSYIIPIKANTKYIFLKSDGSCQGSINAYGIYDETGKSLYYGTGGVTEIKENQAFLRFSLQPSNKDTIVNIQPYDEVKGLNGYDIYGYGVIKTPKFASKDELDEIKDIINGESNKFVSKEEFEEFKENINGESNTLKKPVVMFMFDSLYDNNTCGLLKKYSLHGTYHVGNSTTSFDDTAKTGIKNLIKDGHDIGIYTGNGTRPSTYVGEDSDNWYTYIKKAVDDLKLVGIYNPTSYGCANNKGSIKIYEFAKQLGFKYVRCNYKVVNGETWEDSSTIFENWKNNNQNGLNMCPYSMPEKTFEEIKTQIDYAIANNKILPLFTHGAPTTGDSINVSYAIFEQVCAYVKEKVNLGEVEVLTSRELWNKYNEQEGRWRDYISILSSIVDKY